MSKTTTPLADGWQWHMGSANGSKKAEQRAAELELRTPTPVVSFPSVIQAELLARKHIPDPYIGENERLVQWVSDADWVYTVAFATPAEAATRARVDLVLEGLDTFATVKLNGSVILESDNMFVPARIDVKALLKPSGSDKNTLDIVFRSAIAVGNELEATYGARRSLMRDRRRMHMRKAQYHWGWDWGPVLLTAGPYMPVYLEAYDARIDNVHVVPALAAGNAVATIAVDVAVVGASEKTGQTVELTLVDAAGKTVATASQTVSETSTATATATATASFSLTITSPQLWWPNGQGEQPLYTANVRLVGASATSVDTASARFGVRTVELVQRPLASEPGTTFMFRVNGRDIFIQGGNWIPADMVLPAISRERYFDWVRLAREGNLNMIRVWGGGIYETDDFMDACDEFGLLVWHDYALACGDYPVHDKFIDSIAAEVEVQTKRLRNHPSLALLCGGNEDFMFVDLFDNDMVGPFDDKPFPQRKIYLNTIPRLAETLCPNVPYWANSPFGGAEANDLTVGDIHQWNVWHGQSLPYQDYKKLGGRFVSEFGMHGFPVDRTLAHFCKGAPPHQWHAQSQLIDCHNKSEGAHTRISRYLAENFRYDMTNLSNFSYASQLMQSEAYVYALQHWKRQFRGPGHEACAGLIIWQLNDVYPCTSWAFVDYFLRPKPAYYAIKRAFAPLAVGVERSVASRWIDENKLDEPKGPPSFQLWAHNTAPERAEVTLELRVYDLATEAWLALPEADQKRTVALAAGQTTELGELAPPSTWTAATLVVLEATLVDTKTGAVVARYVDWPEPYRYLVWPADTKLTIAVSHEKHGAYESSVTISANRALKGVWLEPVYDGTETDDSREPVWEDNMVDLMPGQSVTVGVNGLAGRGVKGRFLADWEVGKENPTKLY